MYSILDHNDINGISSDLNVDFYMYLIGNEDGVLYGNKDEGFLFIDTSGGSWYVRYIYVLPEYRGRGVARSILNSVLGYCDTNSIDLYLYLTYNNGFTSGFLHRYVLENQMVPCVPARLYVFDNIGTAYQSEEWNNVLQRMSAVYDRFEKKGFITTTFDTCPHEVLYKLELLYKETSADSLQVSGDICPFIENRYDKLSFITYRGEGKEPISFVYCTRHGNSVIVQGYLAVRKYRTSGLFTLPLYKFIRAIPLDPTIRRISFKLVEYNKESLGLAENLWTNAHPRIVKMQVFARFSQK